MKIKLLFTISILILNQNLFGQSAWEKVDSDLDKELDLIFFINEDLGWSYTKTYNTSSHRSEYKFNKTINGGKNWTSSEITLDWTDHSNISRYFTINDIWFANSDTGWFNGTKRSGGYPDRYDFVD